MLGACEGQKRVLNPLNYTIASHNVGTENRSSQRAAASDLNYRAISLAQKDFFKGHITFMFIISMRQLLVEGLLRQHFTIQLWLSWNSPWIAGWPQTRGVILLILPPAEATISEAQIKKQTKPKNSWPRGVPKRHLEDNYRHGLESTHPLQVLLGPGQ